MCLHTALALSLPLGAVSMAAPPPAPAGKVQVAALIEQLRSDRFEEREKATRALLDLDAIPAELRAAVKSPDPEVRRRAARIVRSIDKRHAQTALSEVPELARAGEVDQAIERVVRWAEEDPRGDSQKALHKLAWKLAQANRYHRVRLDPLLNYADGSLLLPPRRGPIAEGPWEIRTSRGPLKFENDRGWGRFFLRGAGVSVRGTGGGIITSTGPVKVDGGRNNKCLIFSCGPVSVESEQHGEPFLIVCDGDVQVRTSIIDSLIVARGKVSLLNTYKCAIFAGGAIDPDVVDSGRMSVFRSNDSTGLGIVKFFDPAKAGVEVAAGKGGVTVKKAHKDKPFAAILRVGDLVTAIGDVKVRSPEAFRRHLRAALAEGTKTITLTVNRSEKTLAVPVRVRP